MTWTYYGKSVLSHDDLFDNCTDFVYELTYSDNTKYIGKKTIRSISTLPVLKTKSRPGSGVICKHILRDEDSKIITSKHGRKKARERGLKAKAEYYEELLTDKPFIKYEGSSEENKGKTLVSKEILYQCSNKKSATYIETSLLFTNEVLFTDKYNNKNILGRFFDNDLEGLIGEEK